MTEPPEVFVRFVELLQRRLGSAAFGSAWRMVEAMEEADGAVVYFIHMGPGSDAPVKIGTARDVGKRLSELQVGNPVELKIVDRIPGGRSLEAEIHRALSPLRIRGEWFRGSMDIVVLRCALSLGASRLRGALPAIAYPGEEEHVAIAALCGAALRHR